MSVKIKAIERSRKLSMAILAIFVGCFWIVWALSTVNSTSVSAATPANGSASSTADVVLNLTSAISIRTLDSTASSEIESLDLELTPTPSGRFTKDTTVVDVSTSNPSGYKLYMQSDYTDSSSSTPSTPVYTTDMLHSNPSVSDKVANLGSTNVTEVAFSAANSSYRNSWGYSLNGLSVTGSSSPTITPNTNPASIIYNPVPAHANAVTINGGTTSSAEHSYTPVTIGANVDTNIVSGTYTNRLVFSTIANPPYVDYSIKFNANVDGQGGASIGRDDGNDGSVTNLPANIAERVMATSYTITIPGDATTGANVPTRTNYVFSGYNTKPDGTGVTYQPGDAFTLGVEDKQSDKIETASATLYAMWTQYNYTVTIDCNSGTNCPAGTSIATGDSYTYTLSSTTPTRSGYNFKGYLGSDGNTYQPGDTISLNPSKLSITLTAQWAQVYNYSVIVNCDSGTGCPANYSSTTENASFSYNYVISSTVPTRSGYQFNGYLGSDNTTYQPGNTVALSSSKRTVTLTAQWAKLYTYSVTYACNFGTGCPSNYSETITNTTKSYTIPSTAPTRSGYNFKGYLGSDGTTYQPGGTVNLTGGSKESVTLTAQWAQVYNYSVTVNCDSGTGCSSNYSTTTENANFSYNYTISSTVPTRSGYAFNGYKGSDGTTYQPGGTVALSSSKRTITLTAQWAKLYTYKVTYACNSGTGCPSNLNTTITNTGYSYTIPSTAPTRSGYDFVGYLGSDGNTYQPGGTVTLNTSKLSVTLTAQWEEVKSFWTITYMQDMTPELCASATTPSKTATQPDTDGSHQGDPSYVAQRTLYDVRDGSSYIIKKLADGNCWLTENLRLDISDPDVQAKLTSTTTNATDTVLGYLKNGGGSGQYPANGVVAKTASGGSWADDYANPYIATGYKDTMQPASGSAPAGKIGIYYNYCAASAGSYCYQYNNGSGDVSYDICPAGWRLPTTGANGEYQTLYATAYSSNIANFMVALNTPLSGSFVIGSGYSGSNGYFWSSTFADTQNMKGLYITGTNVIPQFASTGYGARGFGFSVRCILNDSRAITDISTMQEMNHQIAAKMNDGETTTLRDVRDDQDYTVAKINGNVWMTQNLRYVGDTGSTSGNMIMKAATSNINSDQSQNYYHFGDSQCTRESATGLTNFCVETGTDDNGDPTAYYNYVAASAGSITGESNSNETASSICPAGWRIPTTSEMSSIGSSQALFSPVHGGYYYCGMANINNPSTYGNWWSSSANGGTYRYILQYYTTSFKGPNPVDRYHGLYVRCVAE